METVRGLSVRQEKREKVERLKFSRGLLIHIYKEEYMHTLFDFITHIKGIEYLVSVSAIGAYMLYWEFLKPKPFKSLVESSREDLNFLKETGSDNTIKTIRKIASAPFIGLAYIVALPAVFAYALGYAAFDGLVKLTGKEASFGWRPIESYLSGKKKEKREKKETKTDEKQ